MTVLAGFIAEADGVNINKGLAISSSLSASFVASAHLLLDDGVYVVWSDQPFALFTTDGATDPSAIPSTQPVEPDGWPGALVGAGQLLQFQMDSQTPVQFDGGAPLFPNGVRMWTLAAAGTFYLTRFLRKV